MEDGGGGGWMLEGGKWRVRSGACEYPFKSEGKIF